MSQEKIYAPTLEGFMAAIEQNKGVGLAEIGVGRTLVVQTQNSSYAIHIVNAETGEVAVTGGRNFPNATVCRLSGSTWRGANIRMRWIGLGMFMEFHVAPGKQITTSAVKKISILGVQPSQHIH